MSEANFFRKIIFLGWRGGGSLTWLEHEMSLQRFWTDFSSAAICTEINLKSLCSLNFALFEKQVLPKIFTIFYICKTYPTQPKTTYNDFFKECKLLYTLSPSIIQRWACFNRLVPTKILSWNDNPTKKSPTIHVQLKPLLTLF